MGLGPQEVDSGREGDGGQRRVAPRLQFLPMVRVLDFGPFATSAEARGELTVLLASRVLLGVRPGGARDRRRPPASSCRSARQRRAGAHILPAWRSCLPVHADQDDRPEHGGVDTGYGVSKERKIGIFLGLLASLGLVAGGYLKAKEAGELPGSLGGAKGGRHRPARRRPPERHRHRHH